jgi:hypothetical protein
MVPPPPRRRQVDTDAIRARITGVGWGLKELPVRRKDPKTMQPYVAQWKLIAHRGDGRSIETTGKTIDEAMKSIGAILGVIPRG